MSITTALEQTGNLKKNLRHNLINLIPTAALVNLDLSCDSANFRSELEVVTWVGSRRPEQCGQR